MGGQYDTKSQQAPHFESFFLVGVQVALDDFCFPM